MRVLLSRSCYLSLAAEQTTNFRFWCLSCLLLMLGECLSACCVKCFLFLMTDDAPSILLLVYNVLGQALCLSQPCTGYSGGNGSNEWTGYQGRLFGTTDTIVHLSAVQGCADTCLYDQYTGNVDRVFRNHWSPFIRGWITFKPIASNLALASR